MAILNIQKLKNITNVLTLDAARLIVHGMVTLHLYYANALYYRLPESSIRKLQSPEYSCQGYTQKDKIREL